MSQTEVKYGWYSKIQKEHSSEIKYKDKQKHPTSSIYLTEDGVMVEVTQVCNVKEDYNLKSFPDAEYRGKVVKWVKSIN